MKIMHVNNHFHLTGGSEQYLFSVCSLLQQRGHRNIILHGHSNGRSTEDSIVGNYMIPGLDHLGACNRDELRKKIASIHNRENPDVIYLHNIHNPVVVDVLTELGPAVKFLHDHELYCPKGTRILNDQLCHNARPFRCTVNAFRGDGFRCMGGRSKPFAIVKTIKQLYKNRSLHRRVKKFIVASHHMKENLIAQSYPEERIVILPYFIEIPEVADPDNGQSNILFIGRISPEKGLDIFLDSIALLKEDFRFVIVGEGNAGYVEILQQKINERKLNEKTDFVGWVDNKRLEEYLKKAAFLVVPSVWPEPFGIVGIEAMAHGRPVIAFDVGGIPEWLEDGKTGFLVKRGDTRAFADKMDLLLKNRSLREELGQNAYRRASRLYHEEKHIEKLISLFQEVVDGDPSLT